MKAISCTAEPKVRIKNIWRLFFFVLFFGLSLSSASAQMNETEFQNLVEVDYDNCTGVAVLKFPVRSNDGSNFAEFLRWIEIYMSPPGGSILMGRVYFNGITAAQNPCSGSSTISITGPGAGRTWNRCSISGSSTLNIVNGTGFQRFMELTVPDLDESWFGSPISFGMTGWYDQECCEANSNADSGFGWSFTHTESWNNGANSTTVPQASISDVTADDCQKATLSWGEVTAPGNCGTVSYDLWRGGFGFIAEDISGTSFVDPGLPLNYLPAGTYQYQIRSRWTPQGSSREDFSAWSAVGGAANVTINPPNGQITVKVKTLGGVGVPGVTCTAQVVMADNMPSCSNPTIDNTINLGITDGNGELVVDEIFYGHPDDDALLYEISGVLGSNNISLDTVSLDDLTSSVIADLIDSTAYEISGRVLTANGCGLEHAQVTANYLDGTVPFMIIPDTTTGEGDYQLLVSGPGNYEITSTYMTASGFTSDVIIENITQQVTQHVDISYSKKDTIRGFVGGSCNAIYGQATINAYSYFNFNNDSCLVGSTMSDPVTGLYEMVLPSQPLKIIVENYMPSMGPLVGETRSMSQEIELDSTNVIDFIFLAPISLNVVGLPDQICSSIAVPILEQARPYTLAYEVLVGNSCPIDTGYVIVIDEIRSVDQTIHQDTFPISTGYAVDILRPGIPNIFGDYTKTMTVQAFGFDGTASAPVTLQAIVTGSAPRGAQIATVSPQIPRLILRDPPGDGSYCSFASQETITTTTSLYAQDSKGEKAWAQVKAGVEISLLDIAISAQIQGGLEITKTQKNSTESTYEVTSTQAFSTSDHPGITGQGGDLYIGAAMNMIYSNSDIISFDLASCEIKKNVELVISPNGFATEFIFTENDILFDVIPSLQTNADDPNTSAEDRHLFLEGIKVWHQVINMNARLKEEAFATTDTLRNITYTSGSGSYEETFTKSSSETKSIEWSQLIDKNLAIEAGFSISGNGISGGYEINLKEEFGESESNATASSTTTTIHLEDGSVANMINDKFSVDIGFDKVYGTPVFRAFDAGKTSCPYELGARRDKPIFSIPNPIIDVGTGVNSVVTQFILGNGSETGEVRDYTLKLTENPDNLSVQINGSIATEWDFPSMSLGTGPVDVLLIRDPALSDFHFEGLKFVFSPSCADAVQQVERLLSVYFESPCSEIAMSTPTVNNGFVINQASNNRMNIGISGYDYVNIGSSDLVKLQYAPIGVRMDSIPTNIQLTKAGLNNNNQALTTKIWQTDNLPEGPCEIRLELTCTSGGMTTTTYSNRVSGLIDRTSPSFLGVQEPADDDYESGDQISVTFDESIDMTNVSVSLIQQPGDVVVSTTFNYVDSLLKLIITPSYDISLDLGSVFDVVVSNVQDLSGNEMEDEIIWSFTVGEIDTDGDGYTDSYEQCIGSALDFDGVDDYMTAPHNSMQNLGASDFTLAAWVNPSSNSTTKVILMKGTVSAMDYRFMLLNSKMYLNGRGAAIEGISLIPTNTWSHVAVSYNSTANQVTFYLNGAIDRVGFFPSTPVILDTNPLQIGGLGSALSFAGRMDDVTIWKHNLTQAEIMATMAGTLAGTEPDLVAHYDFNDFESCKPNIGNGTASDKSSNNSDATLINFSLDGCTSNWATERFMDNDRDGIPDGCDEIEDCFDLQDTGDADGDLLLACADLCPATKDVALDFIGSNNFLAFNYGQPVVDSSFAFEAWVNPVDENEMGIFFGQDSDVNPSYGLLLRYQKIVLVLFESATSNHTEYLYSLTDVPLNQWSHIAVSFDASTKQATFYLNGEFDVVRQSEHPSIYEPAQGTLLIGLGRDSVGVSSFFKGRMDDVAIWSRSLSEYNIKQSMAAPLSGAENGLVAYFDFNEGIACADNSAITTAFNKNTSNNNATLIGFNKTTCVSNYVMGRNTDSDGDMIGDACDVSAFGCPPNYAGANQLVGDQVYPIFYDTDGAIESKQVIEDAAGVIYNTNTSVELLPEFEVELGSTLEIKLDGCPD